MEENDYARTRILDVLSDMAPKGAHCFLNGPYPTSPHWFAGWIDDWQNPKNGFITKSDFTESLLRRLKKERHNRKK